MATAELRSLFEAGVSYDEIAAANKRATGWKPTRSGVARKLDRLGFPPRHLSHADLIPWRISPKHDNHRYRHMLQAEGRRRQGKELSDSDRILVSLLDDLLSGRGRRRVVDYRPDIGFYLVDREDTDVDIIRAPEDGTAGSA